MNSPTEAVGSATARPRTADLLARKAPQNPEAERCVLGSILIDNDAVGIVSEIIRPEDFYDADNRAIYEIITALYEANRAVDAVVVKDKLDAEGRLEGMGGVEALVAIMESVPSAANVSDYAEIVRDRAQKRRLIGIANKVIEDAYGAQGEAKDLVEYVESEVFRIAENRSANEPAEMKKVLLSTVQMIEEFSRNKGKMTGCGTDFHQLDNMTNGFQPGDLVILAARPSVGKTTFAINCAMNMAVRHDKAIAFFSLEMGKEQIASNMLCAQSEVRASHVRKGNISETEWAQLLDGAGRLNDRPIFIDDTPGLSPTALRAKARRLKRRSHIDALFIDYLQLMESPGIENRQQQISTISRSLKLLARELRVPIIALSQINRSSEKEDRKPRMSDLRESGAIEQDADMVMFLHDPTYKERGENDAPPQDGKDLELIIAKHRNGETGNVPLKFMNQMMLFRNPPSRY